MRSTPNRNFDTLEEMKKEPEAEEKDETFLPPRKAVHPTEKETWIRIFYRSLLWLFITLVAGLVVWGWQLLKKGI